ncbi:MAG: quinol:electron acceptor oxidoreductase subunit ActD [Vicinamibacterales bacterium]
MIPVYALYDDPEIAQRAVDLLRTAGVPDQDIVVMSSEPFEEFEFSHRDRADWLFWVAGLGGVAGLAFGQWLTSATQRAWPLRTSGMPIVAPWPNLVVIFELTMLGAMLTTVITLFITAKLPSRPSRLYDVEVSDGYILVGVKRSGAPADVVAQALEAAGPGRLKTLAGQ